MSYNTNSLIIRLGENENQEEIKNKLKNMFRFHNVREVYTPFKGLICQFSDYFRDHPYTKYSDSFFQNQNEVYEHFDMFEQKIYEISKEFKEFKFAYIEVECRGGKCASEGYILQNGEKIFEKEYHHSAHIGLMKKIEPSFRSWFFHPFTRYFFHDKGGLNGEIFDFGLPAIWMAFNVDLGENPNFRINVSENELQVINDKVFEFYLMKIGDNRLKVLGRLFNNENEEIKYIKSLLNDILTGIPHYIEIDDFEHGSKSIVKNVEKSRFEQLEEISYRKTAFNVRAFQYPKEENKKSGFFAKLFKKLKVNK